MAGVSYNVKFDAVRNGKCQEAALMMDANNALNHNPPHHGAAIQQEAPKPRAIQTWQWGMPPMRSTCI